MIVAIIGYLLVVIAVFGKALVPAEGFLIFGDDIHRQYYFYRQFFNSFIRDGTFPWWNPYLFSGTPFIANPVVNLWYPPNWLFIFLPLNLAYSWHLAFHVFWAMLGMMMLVGAWYGNDARIGDVRRLTRTRDVTGFVTDGRPTSLSAWISGLIFGLSGFFMARTWAGHVDMIAAASWMPWVVGTFFQLTRAELSASWRIPARKLIMAAIVFAMQLLAGYQTMAFMTAIAVGIVTLVHCYIQKNIRPLLLSALAGLSGIALAAVQLIPEQEFFRRSIRTFDLPYSWISYGSLKWESLWQLLDPFFFGNQRTYAGPPPNFIEHAMFVGIGGLVLAILGVIHVARTGGAELGISWFSRRQGPDRDTVHRPPGAKAVTALETKRLAAPYFGVSFVVITLFGLWISLGPNAPFDLQYLLWKVVPMYQYLRIPPRHLILVVFGLAGLASLGMSLFRHRLVAAILAAAVVIEMILFGRQFIEMTKTPESRHDQALIQLLTSGDKGIRPYRLLPNFGVWVPPRDSLDFDSVMAYRIFSATGYDPSILRNYYEFADSVNQNIKPSILEHDVQIPYLDIDSAYLNYLNIKYLLVPQGFDPLGGVSSSRWNLVRQAADYRLYENTQVWPRFFLVPQAQTLPSRAAVARRLRDGVDLSKVVLLDQETRVPPSDCPPAFAGRVELTSYTPNRIEFSTDSPCGAYLVSSEVMYPGWEAYLDGTKSNIFEGNLAFRTLYVSKGEHRVVWQYNPRIFGWGALISLLTTVGLVVLLKRS